MGGILSNWKVQVLDVGEGGEEKVIGGLYAAGEAACVSVHGRIGLVPILYSTLLFSDAPTLLILLRIIKPEYSMRKHPK